MNLGILLWNTCNARCGHCAVNSAPEEVGYMTDDDIFSAIDAAFYDCHTPSIGLSGGEAFLYFDRLCTIVAYATGKGARVAINTNGFWGTTLEKAVEKVGRLRELNVSLLTVSMDDFHSPYVKEQRVMNVVRACKQVHLEVRVQFVATKRSRRLGDLLKEHGDTLLNIECREIPCHPVGRAALTVPDEDLFCEPELPTGLCPSAILSISAYGRALPCCNTAGHLPALDLGSVHESLPEVHQKFVEDPVMHMLRTRGPAALWDAALAAGHVPREAGHIDQCHLCYELFKDTRVAQELRQAAQQMLAQELTEVWTRDYEAKLAARSTHP